MTVLILAAERDSTADRMVRELDHRGVPVLRCDTAWFPREVRLDARCVDGRWAGTLTVRHRRVELRALRSVWYRSPSAFVFPGALSPTERHWAGTEARLGLGGVLTALPLLWINHPARLADAAAKPLQLTTAARAGLAVPDTVVTNSRGTAAGFAAAGATVAKALGAAAVVEAGGRHTVFTRLLAPDQDLHGVEVTLHQFQRWVPKAHETRLVVVGEDVFAAGIHASTEETRVDWRASYSDLAYSRPTIPDDVHAGVLQYCRSLGLHYGAFDFVVRPDGRWVFLECNAGGQYGWIEDAVSAPITARLADHLADGAAA